MDEQQYPVYYSGDGKYTSRNRKKKKSFFSRFFGLVFSGLIIGTAAAFAFSGVIRLLPVQNSETAPVVQQSLTETTAEAETLAAAATEPAASTLMATAAVSSNLSVSQVAQQCLPGVVSITNISVQEVQSYFRQFGGFGGRSQLQESTSCGSGVIFSQDSSWYYIVTNAHVVEDATTLTVSFADDSAYDASLCAADSDLDLAVIKVAASDLTAETLAAIRVVDIGSSDALVVGEQVVAIGNALGYGQSVTTGIVSALNRGLSGSTATDSSTYIQTDAAINPGNSGGALLNMSGQLVGINSAKQASTDVEGMGYAIPISQVLDTIQYLMQQDTPLNTQITQTSQQYVGQYGGQYGNQYGGPSFGPGRRG